MFSPVGAGETNAKSETTMQRGGRAKDALCAVACGETPLNLETAVDRSQIALIAFEINPLETSNVRTTH